MTDTEYRSRRSRDQVFAVVSAPFKAALEGHFLANREKYPARSHLYRELLKLGFAQLSATQQEAAPDDGGPYFATFAATPETPAEWREWLEKCPSRDPLALSDIADVCASARCTATLRDAAGLVHGSVDAAGVFILKAKVT